MLNELWGAVDVVELDAGLMLSADIAARRVFVGTTPSTARLRLGCAVRDASWRRPVTRNFWLPGRLRA